MQQITLTELEDKISRAQKVVHYGLTSETNKTRQGTYVTITIGLSVWTYFIGMDLENNKFIVEVVG